MLVNKKISLLRLVEDSGELRQIPTQERDILQENRIERLANGIVLHQDPFSLDDTSKLRNIYAVVKEQYITGIINGQELGKHRLETFTRDRLLEDSEIPLWSTVGRDKFSNFHATINC